MNRKVLWVNGQRCYVWDFPGVAGYLERLFCVAGEVTLVDHTESSIAVVKISLRSPLRIVDGEDRGSGLGFDPDKKLITAIGETAQDVGALVNLQSVPQAGDREVVLSVTLQGVTFHSRDVFSEEFLVRRLLLIASRMNGKWYICRS